MRRPFPIGLTPPDWLVRNLRPQPAPVNRPAVAAVALTLPLVLGLAAGRPTYGALAAMGALSGVISDTADAYRMRLLNIAIPQPFSARTRRRLPEPVRHPYGVPAGPDRAAAHRPPGRRLVAAGGGGLGPPGPLGTGGGWSTRRRPRGSG